MASLSAPSCLSVISLLLLLGLLFWLLLSPDLATPRHLPHTYLKFLLSHSALWLEKHCLITLSHDLCEVYIHDSSCILYQVGPFNLIVSHLSRCDSGFIWAFPEGIFRLDEVSLPCASIVSCAFFSWTFSE